MGQADLWFCCKCKHFWACQLYYTCINCHHPRGQCCTYQRVGKPANLSVRHPQEAPGPAVPVQQSNASQSVISRPQDADPQTKIDKRLSSGPGTPSQPTGPRVVPITKGVRARTVFEVQGDQDGDNYALLLQVPEAMIPGPVIDTRLEPGLRDSQNSFHNNVIRLLFPAHTETSPPAKIACTVSAKPQTRLIEQGLLNETQCGDRWPRSSVYYSPPAGLSERRANDDGPQVSGTRPITSTETISVETQSSPSAGVVQMQQSLQQDSAELYKHPRPICGFMSLSYFRSFNDIDAAAISPAGNVVRWGFDGYDDMPSTLHPISATPLLLDSHDVGDHEFSDLLIQKLYSAVCFTTSGCFRSRGGSQFDKNPNPFADNYKTQTAHHKRRFQDDCDENRKDGGDEERKSSRIKRSRVKPRALRGLLREFACPFCKRNLDYGWEARCIGWSTSSIDHVLRRHLLKHVDIEPRHLSEAKYDRVNEMRRDYNISDSRQAEELWIAAYMEIFEIDQLDRHTVPSPYLTREEFPPDSGHAAFFSRAEGLIGQNPTLAIQMRAYVSQIEAVRRETDSHRRRLREQYRAQEAPLIQDNRRRLEAAEQQLDRESDERHLRLNLQFDSVFAPQQQRGEDAGHHMPREGVGTAPVRDIPSGFRVPDRSLLDRGQPAPSDPVSSHVPGDYSSSSTDMVALLTLDRETRGTPGLLPGDNPFDANLPFGPPSMTPHDTENEVILGALLRQQSPLGFVGESRPEEFLSDALPSLTDGGLWEAPATIPPIYDAQNRPDTRFLTSDSRYASPHKPCDSCGRVVFNGQNVCDSCTGVLDTDPSFWFCP